MTATRASAAARAALHTSLTLVRAIVADTPTSAARALHDPAFDPAEFAGFAEQHRLLGFAYRELARWELSDRLPERELARAKAYYLRQWSKNERLAGELARLWIAATRAGLEVLSLKGPLFSQRYFGDLDARAISDLDFLVRRERDADALERVLLADGYTRESRLLLGRRLSRAFSHHFEYRKGDLVVEVHWVLQRH